MEHICQFHKWKKFQKTPKLFVVSHYKITGLDKSSNEKFKFIIKISREINILMDIKKTVEVD